MQGSQGEITPFTSRKQSACEYPTNPFLALHPGLTSTHWPEWGLVPSCLGYPITQELTHTIAAGCNQSFGTLRPFLLAPRWASTSHTGLHRSNIPTLLNTSDPGTCSCMFMDAAGLLLACSLSTADGIYHPARFHLPVLPVLQHLVYMRYCLHRLHQLFFDLSLLSFKAQSHTRSFLKFIFTPYLFKEHLCRRQKYKSSRTQEQLSFHPLCFIA